MLEQDELPPFEVTAEATAGEAASAFFIICDHAGRLVPRRLGDLGVPSTEFERHVAWDIGAGAVARGLARALGAFGITQRYSRLVIDCNRPLSAPDSIATTSERTAIPGNVGLDAAAAEARARAIFHPYHDRIRGELDRRQALPRSTILVSVHSFTPVYLDVRRPWHAGVLHLEDHRLATPLLRLLGAEPGLVVGDNEPYRASPLSDYSIVEHAERRGLPYVELEIRQDLIADATGQAAWIALLARLLPLAAESLDG